MMEDIAILTSGTLIAEEQGFKLENADLSYFRHMQKKSLLTKTKQQLLVGCRKKRQTSLLVLIKLKHR